MKEITVIEVPEDNILLIKDKNGKVLVSIDIKYGQWYYPEIDFYTYSTLDTNIIKASPFDLVYKYKDLL